MVGIHRLALLLVAMVTGCSWPRISEWSAQTLEPAPEKITLDDLAVAPWISGRASGR